MASCATCGSTIIMGGVRDGDLRYCNAECQSKGYLHEIAAQLPEDLVRDQVAAIHSGECPVCGGPGPVDVHESYQVWSVLVLTSWRTNRTVGCSRCGTRAKLTGLAISTVAGWWGFPWGLVMTPVQILRNIAALSSSTDPQRPSPKLDRLVRLNLASLIMASKQAETPPT